MDLISAFSVVQLFIHSVPNQICMFQYLMNINLYGHSNIHHEYLDMCEYTRFNTFCVYVLEVIQIQYVHVIVTIYTCVVKATSVNLTKIGNPRRLHILHNNNNKIVETKNLAMKR